MPKYEYDFGGSLEHEITLENYSGVSRLSPYQGAKTPWANAPEDVGRLPGIYGLLEAVEDAYHPEHMAVCEWRGGTFCMYLAK